MFVDRNHLTSGGYYFIMFRNVSLQGMIERRNTRAMAKEYKLSQSRLKALEEELEYLRTTREKEVAEMIKEARSFGDLSENAEYDAAKNEQAKNEYDIIQLENELKNAKVIDENSIDTTTVSVGTTVDLVNTETNMEMTFRIVGSAEADPAAGRISNESPVGRALLGHKLKQIAEVQTPGGLMKLRIKAIKK